MDGWHRRMQRAWTGIAHFLTSHAGIVLAGALAVSIVLAVGASRLTFATGQDSYLNSDSEIAIDNEAYQDLFGGEAMLSAFEVPEGRSIVELFTAENIAEFDRLQAELAETPGVLSSVSPVSALRWSDALVTAPPGRPSTESPAGQILQERHRPRQPSPATSRRGPTTRSSPSNGPTEAGEPSLDNPAWVEFLLFDNQGTIRAALRPFFPTPPGVEPTEENATHAQMVTRLDGNQALSEQSEAATAVEEAFAETDFSPAATLTTGAPVLLKDVNDYLQGGMLVLGAIAMVIMIVVLAAAFRVRWRLTSLVVMLAGVLWCFGILGYSGFELSLVTIAGLPILIGLGVDFAIQVHNRVEEEILLDKESTPFVETLRNLGPPLAVATVAGVIACLALLVSQVPMIRDFGVLLALGIVMEFAAAIDHPDRGDRPTRAPLAHHRVPRAAPRRADHDRARQAPPVDGRAAHGPHRRAVRPRPVPGGPDPDPDRPPTLGRPEQPGGHRPRRAGRPDLHRQRARRLHPQRRQLHRRHRRRS